MQWLYLDGCHNMTQVSMSFDNVAIVTVGGNDYRIKSWFMNKSEAVNRMKNSDLYEKRTTIITKNIYYSDAK